MQVFGFDIGGTTAEAAVVNEGKIVESSTIQTGRNRGPEEVADALAKAVAAMGEAGGEAVSAAGAGIAGQVRADDRRLGFAPNLGWRDVPLADLLEERLQVPVFLLNDGQAAALAEATRGAGQGSDEVLVVYVGTGIGGGIVVTGELRRGCSGCAGEVGHLPIVHGGRRCRCGVRGCLEAYAGGWAIAERAREAAAEDPETAASIASAAGSMEAITAETVSSAAGDGDELAKRLVEETADYLATGLAGLINVLSPCLMVVGGGVALHMPGLLARASELALYRALPVPAKQVEIRRARLAGDAGVIGAADWAVQRSGH